MTHFHVCELELDLTMDGIISTFGAAMSRTEGVGATATTSTALNQQVTAAKVKVVPLSLHDMNRASHRVELRPGFRLGRPATPHKVTVTFGGLR